MLRAEGDAFCAGVDLALIEECSRSGSLLKLIEKNGETLRRLDKLTQLVIVAVNGPALGVGAHLALCGDILLRRGRVILHFRKQNLGFQM